MFSGLNWPEIRYSAHLREQDYEVKGCIRAGSISPAVVLMSCERKMCHSQIVVRTRRNPGVIVKPPLPFQTHDSWVAG